MNTLLKRHNDTESFNDCYHYLDCCDLDTCSFEKPSAFCPAWRPFSGTKPGNYDPQQCIESAARFGPYQKL
jgi:hypothetical protein